MESKTEKVEAPSKDPEKLPIMYFASKQKLQYNLLESAIHQFARQFLMIRGNYNGIIVETRRISRPTHYPVMHRL